MYFKITDWTGKEYKYMFHLYSMEISENKVTVYFIWDRKEKHAVFSGTWTLTRHDY